MVNTTEAWKSEISQPIRRPCHLKLSFGVIDPTAKEASTLSDNGHLPYSDVEHVEDSTYEVGTKLYATLEHNFWVLNDNYELYDENETTPMYQGFVSSVLSDENGNFEEGSEPQVIVDFDEAVKFRGLTMDFEPINNEYPTEITITTFVNNTLVETLVLNPNNSHYVNSHSFDYMDKMIFTFNSTNKPYRRVRFTNVLYGIIYNYDTSNNSELVNLVSAKETKKMSLVSSELPTYKFTFSVNNFANSFDPDVDGGVMDYIVSNQEVNYSWGIETESGNIEWIKGGKVLTNSNPSVSQSELTVDCTDRLTLLTDEYNRGLYRPSGISLYDLAEEVLEFANLGTDDNGYPMYILDSSLANITTYSALPIDSIKACLQLIANAGRCIIYTNRDGKIVIKPRNSVEQDMYITLDDFLEEVPKTEVITLMKSAKTVYYTYTVASSSTQIGSLKTRINGTENITINYNSPATNVSASITNGTINSATYYTNACVLNITGNASADTEITLNGKELTSTSTEVIIDKNPQGEIAESVNPLICTYEDALDYITFFGDIIEYRKKYTSKFVGRPELDVGDVIKCETRNTQEMKSIVTETNIDYKGSFGGDITFVKDVD